MQAPKVRMRRRQLATLLAAIIALSYAAPAFSAQEANDFAHDSSIMRFAYHRDEKIGRWMDELQSHIIFHYLERETLIERGYTTAGPTDSLNYYKFSSLAKKMVKRARKKWGDSDRDTIYVMNVALLVFINYRVKTQDISMTKARELVGEALIAPPREVFYDQPHAEYLAWKLSALHDLTAARIERFAHNNAGARDYYNKAIEKFQRLGSMGLGHSLEIIDVILTEMNNDMESGKYFYE